VVLKKKNLHQKEKSIQERICLIDVVWKMFSYAIRRSACVALNLIISNTTYYPAINFLFFRSS